MSRDVLMLFASAVTAGLVLAWWMMWLLLPLTLMELM